MCAFIVPTQLILLKAPVCIYDRMGILYLTTSIFSTLKKFLWGKYWVYSKFKPSFRAVSPLPRISLSLFFCSMCQAGWGEPLVPRLSSAALRLLLRSQLPGSAVHRGVTGPMHLGCVSVSPVDAQRSAHTVSTGPFGTCILSSTPTFSFLTILVSCETLEGCPKLPPLGRDYWQSVYKRLAVFPAHTHVQIPSNLPSCPCAQVWPWSFSFPSHSVPFCSPGRLLKEFSELVLENYLSLPSALEPVLQHPAYQTTQVSSWNFFLSKA